MATMMLRECSSFSNLPKLLRSSQIRLVKFSTDSGDPPEGEKDLIGSKTKNQKSSLASALRSSEKSGHSRRARPSLGKLLKRDLTGKIKNTEENLDILGMDRDEVLKATKEVSSLTKGVSRKARTQSDLLLKLKSISEEAKAAKTENEVVGEEPSTSSSVSATSLVSDMKLEKSEAPATIRYQQQKEKSLSADEIEFLEKRAAKRRSKMGINLDERSKDIDIFAAPPLGVFTSPFESSVVADNLLLTWRACAQRELKLKSIPAPRNALEEMIEWTEDGKLWKFPIDNEQDLDYSHEPFHEHVFLENLLDPWCPKFGPVRHFMDLVCVGLSKNPYVTAEFKRDTITWFKDYFEQPKVKDILTHQGSWHEQTEETAKI